MLPSCNEVIPLGLFIFGVGVGILASLPTVWAAWFVGRQGRRAAIAKLGELVSR